MSSARIGPVEAQVLEFAYEFSSGYRHFGSRNCHTGYLNTQAVYLGNGLHITELQNDPLLQDGNQFLSTVFNGPRIGPHSFETRNFGEPCPVIQLFAFHLLYG